MLKYLQIIICVNRVFFIKLVTIYPYFTYGNQVWGNACDTHLHQLILLQKRCVRIITRSKYRAHTDPLFAKLNLLKIHDINKYLISKFMHRWFKNDLPSIFYNMFTPVRDVHSHNTRQCSFLYCPDVKLSLGKRKMSYQAPQLWNQILKAKINPEVSPAVFCKSIKQCIRVGLL